MAADTFLTHDMLAERSLFDIYNQLTFSKYVYKGYNSNFNAAVGGYKKGDSVAIQLPNKMRTHDGANITGAIPGIQESSTPITVDEHHNVPWDFIEQDLTLEIEGYSKKYLKPATIALGNLVDLYGCKEHVNLYNQVGAPGTTPSTFGVLADAALRMDQEGIVRQDRNTVFSAKAHWSMADGELKTVFQQNIVDTMLRRGFIGNFALMDFYMDQNIQNHTNGHFSTGSTPVMQAGTAENATVIQTDGWGAAGTVKKGDRFTIATIAGVNPVSGENWEGNEPRQFVATADAEDDGGGNMTIYISPAIVSSAAGADLLPYQTVNDLPTIGEALTFIGTEDLSYPQNMAYHPNCFALTTVPFAKPKSAGASVMWGQANDDQLGLSITIATGFDILTYVETTRLDILFGWDTPQPNYGVVITG